MRTKKFASEIYWPLEGWHLSSFLHFCNFNQHQSISSLKWLHDENILQYMITPFYFFCQNTVVKILNLWLKLRFQSILTSKGLCNILKKLNGGNKCRRWCSQDEIYAIVAETQHAKCCIRLTNASKNFIREHFV